MSKKMIVERDVEARMRDGVILRADVYRPDVPESIPVILQRTPYGKGFSQLAFALLAAERGYAVIIQDTRGRWASDGDGYPFLHEMEDGYDTVEWTGSQHWSNGKVGMFGGSYVGYTQFAAAAMQPAALKTITPTITFCDPGDIFYRGGAITLGSVVSWGLMAQAMMAIMRHPGDQMEKALLTGQLIEAVDGMALGKTFSHLPLVDLPLIGRAGITPYLADALSHPPEDPFWKQALCSHHNIKVPALHIGGWYDLFTNHTLNDFNGIRLQGNPSQKVLIGPWIHGAFDGINGEVDFGLQASALLLVPDEFLLRWFDYWLKGIDNGIMQEPPVQIFVMGDNQWRLENEWPLARTQYIPYYLHSNGAANTLNGNGTLSPEKPTSEAVDSYVYDPHNPVPTRGGALCCWEAALPAGAYDQREIEERTDVLVFTTPPLEKEVEVTGPIQVHLWAATNAPDTDFTAKLVDVYPDGTALHIADGQIRARYREQHAKPELLVPGKVYQVRINLGSVSNLFVKGHRIRLDMSSSNFPKFEPNSNTGDPPGKWTRRVKAKNTIFVGGGRASYLELSVRP